jgi:hypothetical protein
MPDGFLRRWLAFDPSRPTRRRLARRFVVALIAMLAATAYLAWLTSR